MINNNELNTCWAVLLAGGSGARFGGSVPKSYQLISGRPTISWAIKGLSKHNNILNILPVINKKDEVLARQSTDKEDKCLVPIAGGNTRLQSFINAVAWIKKQPNPPEYILVHDAARPFIPLDLIGRLLNKYSHNNVCILPVLPVSDSLTRSNFNANDVGLMQATVSRLDLKTIQTPQLFSFNAVESIFLNPNANTAKLINNNIPEWEIIQSNNENVLCITGDARLNKLTYEDDLAFLEYNLNKTKQVNSIFKSSLGYDIHRFSKPIAGKTRELRLGGILIRDDNGLAGHSDADVLLHALCDSLYGLAAKGDIGIAFPPSDIKWKNANSSIFVKEALNSFLAVRGKLVHVDCTIIAEAPKLADYRDKIISYLAKLLSLNSKNISLKATTNEEIGCIGRSEGIAAFVLCSASFPG